MTKNGDANSTDLAWQEWGRIDPYFGVITDRRYRRAVITDSARKDFFESGVRHAEYVLERIRTHIAADFAPRRILDFGCGVGRILVPFARLAEAVVGVDVSTDMLQEARNNCAANDLTNVSLHTSSDQLSAIGGDFDLVHSFIVLQHIPPERGRVILKALLARIVSGGVGALHILYSKIQYADNHGVPPTARPPRARRGRADISETPEMQMNPYSVNELLFFIQAQGVQRVHLEFTDHGGELGLFVFFQKPRIDSQP